MVAPIDDYQGMGRSNDSVRKEVKGGMHRIGSTCRKTSGRWPNDGLP
jgi:hypothetical protein